MKKLGLVAGLFCLTNCNPSGTGIDNALYTKQSCPQYFKLDNQSTVPLRMVLSIASWQGAECEDDNWRQAFRVVPPGSRDYVHVDMKCIQCDKLSVGYRVAKASDMYNSLYTENMGSADVVCTDTACTGR